MGHVFGVGESSDEQLIEDSYHVYKSTQLLEQREEPQAAIHPGHMCSRPWGWETPSMGSQAPPVSLAMAPAHRLCGWAVFGVACGGSLSMVAGWKLVRWFPLHYLRGDQTIDGTHRGTTALLR